MVVSQGRTGMGRRVLLVIVLLLLAVFLIHGFTMGPHHVADSGCGTCVTATLLLTAVAVLLAGWTSRVVSDDLSARRAALPPEAPPRPSRHPPDEGTVLRL